MPRRPVRRSRARPPVTAPDTNQRASARRPPVHVTGLSSALAADATLFQTIWDTASDAMVLSDPDGIVCAANPAYFALYGYPPELVLGHSFAIIFPAERRAWAVELYRTAFTSPGVPAPYESTILRADGTERIVESRIDFLTTDGTRTAMLSTIRD